ncbi:uncharacterized protein LOC130733602 isoform X2 [Lotus japonicus]|uniref:uncharacterized protein LOC130733602 isoform X2 n=1 Tax=Lotus japonicus TaxID=34305 RepID=UPI00258D1DF6|nr:uncharacterized protein LOC130733602 isoform X2 [Lotus japonicus]
MHLSCFSNIMTAKVIDDKDVDNSVTDNMNKKSVSRERRVRNRKAKRNDFRLQELQPSQNKTPKSARRGRKKGKKGSGQKGSYANQPVSFVSSGRIIQSETVEVTAVDSQETDGTDKKGISITSSANIGSFEVHTNGFGSKMMAKMGYVEGEGLGKNGQGMAQPIEVIQRPKSLGLGVPATEPARRSKSSRIGTSEKHTRTEPPRSMSSGICAFEKHTKGFGSKMMAKMGFVDGSGLGRDSQGITIPLSAVRRPKSRGLGSKGNDDLIEDFPDAISDMYSKGMTSEVLDRRTSEFTAIHEESSCAYEENPNRISAVELDSDLHTSSMQHTKQILKSDHAIGHGPIMKNIMPEPSQVYSKVATQGLNTYCSEFNWSRSQPGVIPKTFQGHPFTFLKSKTSVSSAPISKPRTWHRSGNNPTTSLPRIKPLAGTAPPKRPILEGKGNFQNTSTSYIRKGNSLVRKPSPVSALSQIFSVNQSPARSESRAGVIDRPMYLKTGETNTTQEGPRTPSLPIDNKSQENITSPLVNPPSSGCCENLSDPSKSIEANYAPKSSEDALKHFETSDNQPGLSNNGESQVEANDGNISSMKARRIVYMKPTTNQLVATSSSCDIVSTDQKGQIAFSNGYYKRSKNQLVRTTFESHINQTIAMPNSNVDSDGRGASKVLCNRRSIKRRSYKVARSSGKPSNASLVWTLCGNNSSRNDSDSLHHQKVLPHLCPWKRTTYLRSSIRNSASSFDSSSSLSAISKKLLLSRKRKTVHTRSTHGVSLWKSKELGVGGYSLKWSKSIEEHSKKANEEATLAAAAVERKKREQEDEACINSQAKRERIFRIGSVRYRMDPSRRTLQRISGSAARRAYVPRRLVIGNDEYVRIGNGNQLIRDPKKRTRKLANEKVRWSLHTARQRFARKQKYCQFFTRFGKCNKDGGKCPYIHDPSKVAVCTKFLNGLCSTPNCKLTHKVIQERMPDCSYFFQGLCTNRNCPYRHVNVNPKASICEGFLKGYCADGNECLKKHSYVCPTFEATGTCVQGTKCKLHHPKKQSKGKKRKRSEDQNSRGRYFGSIPVDVSEPGMMVAASSHQDLDLEKELSDYISLDVNEEVADMVDQSFEHSEFCDNDSMDLQLDTTDELKPVLIITKLASQAS